MFVGAKIKNFIGIENKDFVNNVSLDCSFFSFSGMNLLNLSTWYLKPSSLDGCFYDIEVEKLDVSNFNLEDFKNLDDIFYSEHLREIYIRNWDTSNLEYIDDNFFNYEKLEKVYLNIDNNLRIVEKLGEHGFICNNGLCSKNTSINNNLHANISKNISKNISTNVFNKFNNNEVFHNDVDKKFNLTIDNIDYIIDENGETGIMVKISMLFKDYIVNPFKRILGIR